MKLYITLAWRNLWRNKRRTLITLTSVSFAVIFAILFDSMERGSYERMIDNMVKYSTGYIQIQDFMYDEEPSIDHSLYYGDEIKATIEEFSDEIEFVVPRIQNFALAATDDITRGALVMGIDPESENRLNGIRDDLISGEFLLPDDDAIMLANGLAERLKVDVGDTIVLISQGFQGASASGMYPIKGIVKLMVPEMSNNTLYMPIKTAQWFFMMDDHLTSLIIMPNNPNLTNQLVDNLTEKIDTGWYTVYSWEYLLADLLRLMKFDMAGSRVLIFILYIVIAFGLFGTILTMMMERLREFGMLISLGMKRYQLSIICFLESILITFSGVLTGIAASLPIVLYFFYNPIRLTGEMADMMLDYGFEPIMPFSTNPQLFIAQAQVVFVISILIGLYPVYKVFRLRVIEAMK